ncbi:hypothetical protein SUGI_0280320 [Cryptomeria japonica]|nr:hypothetical protein SUGI_0280320 [Cryptomeria japonica]
MNCYGYLCFLLLAPHKVPICHLLSLEISGGSHVQGTFFVIWSTKETIRRKDRRTKTASILYGQLKCRYNKLFKSFVFYLISFICFPSFSTTICSEDTSSEEHEHEIGEDSYFSI